MGELGDRLARGDREAFGDLYDACADSLYRFLVVRLGARADAEDVVQETFVRLARLRRGLAHVDNPVAYVFTIARHEAARLHDRRNRNSAGRPEPLDEVALPGEPAPDRLEARETADAVVEAIGQLPDEQREIVELKHYGELTLREIADVTGLPQGTVASRYRAAVARLRERLKRTCHD